MFDERSAVGPVRPAGPVYPPMTAPAEVSDEDLRAALRECEAAKAAWEARKLGLVADMYRRAAGWLLPSASTVSPPVGQIEVAGQEVAAALRPRNRTRHRGRYGRWVRHVVPRTHAVRHD